MTLLVALKATDGIVAAADSRGTFGDPRSTTAQNDSQRKIHLISAHAVLLLAGSGEIGMQLAMEIEKLARQQNADGATRIMDLVRTTARNRYDEWFPHLPPAVAPGVAGISRPELALIVAGYDPDAAGAFTIPRIYQMVSSLQFAPMLHDYGFALSGVAQYALYLLNRLYEPDRSLDDLKALAVYVITETSSQDGKVGGPVRLVTITPGDGGAELDRAAILRIQETNAKRAEALRKSFYTRGPRRQAR